MQEQIRSRNTEITPHRNGGYSMFNDHSSWNQNLVLGNLNTENQQLKSHSHVNMS